MFEDKIYKLKDIKTFREYERRFKIEQEKIKNNAKWIWFKILNIPEKYKRVLYESIGIDKIYNLKLSQKIILGEKYVKNLNIESDVEDKVFKIVEKYIDEFNEENNKQEALEIAKNLIEENIEVVSLESEYYPKLLKEVYDYPIMFFAKGNLKLLKQEKVGIVGARNCSIYGINITRQISEKLANKGYVITSGLAKGIDKTAHLAANGRTIAVLGTGIKKEVFYPKENLSVYEDILKKGGLIVSEFMPDEPATRYNFPKRNRIIAGMSNNLIITQAAKKSGSLITAEFSLDLGRDIYTVPGDILSKKYDGNNELLKDGAIPILNFEDLDMYFRNLKIKNEAV